MKRGQGQKKPFCDCRVCECKNCPDVIAELGISIKDGKSEGRPKGESRCKGTNRKKCGKELKPSASQTSEHRPSILNMLNPDRNCDCDIMARAIRSHIHKNMGMTERREKNSDHRPSNSKDID